MFFIVLFTFTGGIISVPVSNAQETSKAEEAVINRGDYSIPAIITIPNDATDPVPVVILLHGTGSNKDEAGGGYIEISQALAENGIASIRFDFAGSGDSERDYYEYTVTGSIDDTIAILEYIKADSEKFDSDKIGILGWSQGGYLALLMAGILPDEFMSVVTWAGTTDMNSLISDEDFKEALQEGYFIREYDWREYTNVSLEWVLQVKTIDLLEIAQNYQGPILALHGTEDTVVDPSEADRIVDNSSNSESEFKAIDGADHTFNIFTEDHSEFDELIYDTVEWFINTLDK